MAFVKSKQEVRNVNLLKYLGLNISGKRQIF